MKWKGAFQNLSHSPHCATNSPQHARSRCQDKMVSKYTTTHRARLTHSMSCALWSEATAQLPIWKESKSHLFSVLFHGLKHFTDERPEETRVDGESTENQLLPDTKA